MQKLTREQAISEVGLKFVEQVESAPCDFSNRVTNDGSVEFCATVKAGVDEDGFSVCISYQLSWLINESIVNMPRFSR